MVKPTRRSNRRRHALTLPELEHSKAAVLNSLWVLSIAPIIQARYRRIHLLVLLGAEVGSEPSRGPSLSTAS